MRRRLVDGEWTEVDDLDVAGTEEVTDGGRRGVARRVHRGAALHTPPQHLAGPPDVRRASAGLARNQQSYTDTSAGHRLGGTT